MSFAHRAAPGLRERDKSAPMKVRNFICVLLALTIPASYAAPRERARASAQLRPLTFANAVAFFHEALGRSPLSSDSRVAVFAEGEWKNRDVYNHSLIFIENADEDVEITYIMSGDEGMNWVTEFFDSPFFSRAETESLFDVLQNVRGSRHVSIGRFNVELDRWQPHHHEIVVISLTPRKR